MTRISTILIEEILDEQWGILITRDPVHEGLTKVSFIQDDGRGLSVLLTNEVVGADIGELVNELHSRL